MSIDDFARYSTILHGLTVDFVRARPERAGDRSVVHAADESFR